MTNSPDAHQATQGVGVYRALSVYCVASRRDKKARVRVGLEWRDNRGGQP